MKLFASLYLDEDASVLIADILRARGFDVTTARNEKMLVLSRWVDGSSLAHRVETLSKGWAVTTPNKWTKRLLFSAVFLHIIGSITKNYTAKPLQGKRNTSALSLARVATCMN